MSCIFWLQLSTKLLSYMFVIKNTSASKKGALAKRERSYRAEI
jgi:hypothetical protein